MSRLLQSARVLKRLWARYGAHGTVCRDRESAYWGLEIVVETVQVLVRHWESQYRPWQCTRGHESASRGGESANLGCECHSRCHESTRRGCDIVVEPMRVYKSLEVVLVEVEWTMKRHEENACRGHESACKGRVSASRGLEIGVETRECV
jgi:hypothetical protein